MGYRVQGYPKAMSLVLIHRIWNVKGCDGNEVTYDLKPIKMFDDFIIYLRAPMFNEWLTLYWSDELELEILFNMYFKLLSYSFLSYL